ncbi:MAG: hypothetical protein JNJ40_13975 [Bacteroidia bacterium]|nr:hypothetical protein [Bacteroidia bacterium]
MKKKILIAVITASINTLTAQTWISGGSITGNAYRSGNVGIGNVTAPITKLHVADGVATITGTNSYGGPQIVLGPAYSHNNSWGIETTPTGLNFWRPGSGQTNPGNYFMFLKHTNGNVGIKTDNPTAALTVNGNALIGNPATVNLPAGYKLYVESGILTEKVKVAVKNTGNWADYVFDKNYKMLPLNEVEAYVQKNKHLPGVPSAEEVVENGIDMATMDAKLLEKIEELTLYVIKLEKEMNELKQKH